MRRTLGFVLLVGMTGIGVGCFTPESKSPEAAVKAGPATGDKDRTLEYWDKVREVLQVKSTAVNMRAEAAIVQRQADAIRRLPIDGVDHDLYVAALQVAQNQDKMLKAADAAGFRPSALQGDPELKAAYSAACQQITSATAYLKSLQPVLSARYHVKFSPIEDN
jgi:hypothetical protein